jgi:hypothetical protein
VEPQESGGLLEIEGGHGGFLLGGILCRRDPPRNPLQRSPAWTARDKGLEVLAIRKSRGSASFLARAAPPDVQTEESGDGGAVAFNLALHPIRLLSLFAPGSVSVDDCERTCHQSVNALLGPGAMTCHSPC